MPTVFGDGCARLVREGRLVFEAQLKHTRRRIALGVRAYVLGALRAKHVRLHRGMPSQSAALRRSAADTEEGEDVSQLLLCLHKHGTLRLLLPYTLIIVGSSSSLHLYAGLSVRLQRRCIGWHTRSLEQRQAVGRVRLQERVSRRWLSARRMRGLVESWLVNVTHKPTKRNGAHTEACERENPAVQQCCRKRRRGAWRRHRFAESAP